MNGHPDSGAVPLIEAAVDTVRPSAVAKDVSVQVEIDPDTSIIVRGEAARLQQIVWNLLSNAVKFTPAGGRVHVELRHTGPWVELVVRDTGEGVASDFLPHMFERFRQSDSRPSRRHGGLGLGLAIVRHLAEAHGGTVGAASEGAVRPCWGALRQCRRHRRRQFGPRAVRAQPAFLHVRAPGGCRADEQRRGTRAAHRGAMAQDHVWQSQRGGELAVARLLTVTRTCQLQQLNALVYLTAAIRCHRRRKAVASLLPKPFTH